MAPLTSIKTARARLAPVRSGRTMLDGCWSPKTDDPRVELPVLVPLLDDGHRPVVRLLLSAAGWSNRPHQVMADGRAVTVGYFAGQSPSRLTAIRADGSILVLLVIPARRPGDAHRGPDQAREDVWEGEGGAQGS